MERNRENQERKDRSPKMVESSEVEREDIHRHSTRESRNPDPIEERILEGGERSQQSMESAAQDAFDRDQRDSDHPSRRRRELNEEFDVDDPSHSQGI